MIGVRVAVPHLAMTSQEFCSTGVPGLDEVLAGGLPRGRLHLIEGNPGVGKTTLAMKIAAVEAHWDGSKPGALVLFAWPDEKTETNLFEIAIPKAGSLILRHDPDGLFPGLKSVAPADRPPLVPVFFAFRSMRERISRSRTTSADFVTMPTGWP